MQYIKIWMHVLLQDHYRYAYQKHLIIRNTHRHESILNCIWCDWCSASVSITMSEVHVNDHVLGQCLLFNELFTMQRNSVLTCSGETMVQNKVLLLATCLTNGLRSQTSWFDIRMLWEMRDINVTLSFGESMCDVRASVCEQMWR